MLADLIDGLDLTIQPFIRRLVIWAQDEADLLALALVGSHARGKATIDSDVDLLLLVRDPGVYLADRAWVSAFGVPANIVEEDWGKVTSLRVFYAKGLEVEFGLCDRDWGSDPGDVGDARVIRDGLIVLYERDGHLSNRLDRFNSIPL